MAADEMQAPADGHGRLGVAGAAALVAGSMVGSGVYLLPATLGAIGSISILGWLAASVAALAIAGMFAWLAPAAPGAKGLPGYVQAGLGRFFGAQTTAAYWTSCWFGNAGIALAVVGAAAYLAPVLQGAGPRLGATLAVIWLAIGACWLGPRVVARVEGLTLGVGLLPVVVAATVGWFWFNPATYLASWNPQDLGLGAAVGGSALNAFWAFLGLESAAAVAGVVRDPARNVPRATLVGVGAVAVLYVAACSALMGVLPAEALARSTAPFADAAGAALGIGLAAVIAACALARAFGAVCAFTLVSAETTRGAADEGAFFAAFRTRPGEPASPINLLTTGVLMSAAAVMTASPTLAEQFVTLANVAVILSLYAYALAGFSLIRLARRIGPGRRVPAVATAAAAIACSAGLIATARPHELAISLVPLAAAVALHLWLRRTSKALP